MNDRIYLSSPDVGASEERAVVAAMRSGWIAPLGPEVDAFEEDLAKVTQRSHAVALSSGTAALHLALLNLGVGPGDIVLTATMTFAATANAVTYTGAAPVFIDCDATGNMDHELLAQAIADQRARGHRVAAVLPVDLLGKVANYNAIEAVADQFDIPVLSDAAESLGARRDGRPAGNFGVAAAVSFNGNKIMTTSGGGALVTDDPRMAERARYLATQARQPVAHYEHLDIGYNYRLSNLLAALGRAQLARLEEMIEKRRAHRHTYAALFRNVAGVTTLGGDDAGGEMIDATRDNFWLTSVLIDPNVAGWSSSDLIQHLARENIEARPLWKPMHAQPVFAECAAYLNGTSDQIFARGVSLPSGSVLSQSQVDRVVCSISAFLGQVRSA